MTSRKSSDLSPMTVARPRASAAGSNDSVSSKYIDTLADDAQAQLVSKIRHRLSDANDLSDIEVSAEVHDVVQSLASKIHHDLLTTFRPEDSSHEVGLPANDIAINMQRSIDALGSALGQMPTPVSPQLARSTAATEYAWRSLEREFGLLTSMEVSNLLGSDAPNRSFASHQRSQGKLIAINRPKGLRYPGFQFDTNERMIRPVVEDLIKIAKTAGRSESSLALWMNRPTGYLEGKRPVDYLTEPEKVIAAAKHSFGVQW